MGTTHQRASDIRSRARSSYVGRIVTDDRNVERDAINLSQQVTQTTSWTFSGGSDTVSIALVGTGDALTDLDAYTFAHTVVASTASTAAAEVAEEWNEDPEATAFGWASASGAVLTITALSPGEDFAFTATKTSAIMGSATTVAGADVAAIPFGRAILAARVGTASGNPASLDGAGFVNRVGALTASLPTAAQLATQVSTITVGGTAQDAKTLAIHLHYGGPRAKSESATVITATSSTTTTIAAQIAAAINALTLATATSSGAVVTVTAAEAGRPITITVGEVDTSTATYTIATTTSATEVEDLLAGIALYKPTMVDSDTLNTVGSEWGAGDELMFLEEGFVNVAISAVPSRNADVYVGFGSGEEGKLFSASGSDRHRWARARWTGHGRDGVATLHLRPAA